MNESARTPTGHGIVIHAAKVMSQLTALHMALKSDWAMDWDFFRSTVAEIRDHTEGLVYPGYMTLDAREALGNWVTYMDDLRAEVRAERDHTNDTPVSVYGESYVDALHDLIVKTWELLSQLDREMFGIETADAGQVV